MSKNSKHQPAPEPVVIPEPTFKIEAVKVGEEYTPPEGWTLKDLVSTPIGKDNEPSQMIFHVVIMRRNLPEKKSGIVQT